MEIERDVWLSERFRHDVFKHNFDADTGETINRVRLLSEMNRHQRAFHYSQIPTGRVDLLQTLVGTGFHLVSANVTFERSPAKDLSVEHPGSVHIQGIEPVHYEAVLDIASTCFVHSRFHLDPAISKGLADEIKRCHIQNYIQKKRGEHLLVGLINGKPAGFLAVLAANVNGEQHRTIDLMGVDRAHQRCGVGKALVSYFIREGSDGCSRFRVGTQLANTPSLRLYESTGFRVVDTKYVLHAHTAPERTP